MPRTTAPSVKAVLGQNYDTRNNPSLSPYIDTASALVDEVVRLAADYSRVLSAHTAELIERWLAAHYYTVMDPLYVSQGTLSSSGSFNPRSYKDVAIELDTTGILAGLLKQNRAGGEWLGKTASEQLSWDQRN